MEEGCALLITDIRFSFKLPSCGTVKIMVIQFNI